MKKVLNVSWEIFHSIHYQYYSKLFVPSTKYIFFKERYSYFPSRETSKALRVTTVPNHNQNLSFSFQIPSTGFPMPQTSATIVFLTHEMSQDINPKGSGLLAAPLQGCFTYFINFLTISITYGISWVPDRLNSDSILW